MTPNISSNFIIFIIVTMILVVNCNAFSDESSQGFGGSNDPLPRNNDDDDAVTKRGGRLNFIPGSRYGRSSPQLYNTKARRLNVAPRNDRFFLGSRYGKRADESSSTPSLFFDDQPDSMQGDKIHITQTKSCIYTGYKNYYKCNNINEIDNIIDKLSKIDGENQI